MSVYTVEIWGDTYSLSADFAEASCPIDRWVEDGEFWEPTAYQVADFRHRPDEAMRAELRSSAIASGDDPIEDTDIGEEIERAISDMTEQIGGAA